MSSIRQTLNTPQKRFPYAPIKCEKFIPQWRVTWKNSSKVLDSNFRGKFQMSLPGWYPGWAIKTLQMKLSKWKFFFGTSSQENCLNVKNIIVNIFSNIFAKIFPRNCYLYTWFLTFLSILCFSAALCVRFSHVMGNEKVREKMLILYEAKKYFIKQRKREGYTSVKNR